MGPSKLILVEGIPGAGKSSTCQLVRRCLHVAGRPAVWWHEEQGGHPVYVFTDRASLQVTLADLGAGRSAAVLSRALDRWRAFVEDATDARGNGHRELYVQRAEGSPYGKRRGLRGFDGLVAYWEAYGAVADELFARSTLNRLELSSAIGWPARRRRLLSFLGVVDTPPQRVDLGRFAGSYDGTEVRLEGEDLFAYDLPDRWHRLRLVPLGGMSFDVESLPHRVLFEEDAAGRVIALRVTGPPMLVTPALDRRLARSATA